MIQVPITRYQMEWVLAVSSACLISFPDLHAIDICAPQEITTLIKGTFKGVYCHPHVTLLPTATPAVGPYIDILCANCHVI